MVKGRLLMCKRCPFESQKGTFYFAFYNLIDNLMVTKQEINRFLLYCGENPIEYCKVISKCIIAYP